MKFSTFARWTCVAALANVVLVGNVALPKPFSDADRGTGNWPSLSA